MRQLTLLVAKELRFWFTRPGVHLFALLFASIGVLTMLALAGQIEFIQIGGMGGLKKADSVNQLTQLTMIWSLFATMNLAAAAGGAATRDVTEGSHPLVFSTPVGKLTFLTSRYLGALAVSAYLLVAIPLGLFVGRFVPGLEPERIGAFDPLTTLASVVVWVGPNLVFVTALFFGIGALTRRMFPIYLGGVLLFVGYLASGTFVEDLDDRTLAVLLDPFGVQGIEDVTRYWSPEQTNTDVPWPVGRSLANRVLWLVVGVASLAGCVGLTRLDQYGWQPLARLSRGETVREEASEGNIALPAVTRSFSASARLAQLLRLCRRSVLDVVGHRYFWGFVGAAVLFQLLNSQAIGVLYGTQTLPVTYEVLKVLTGTLQLFLLMVITFYAGDLVWADRESGQAQLFDSAPVADWAPLLAKWLALIVLVAVMHLIPLIIGPAFQLLSGYPHLELWLYVQTLAMDVVEWVPLVCFALAVHVVVDHKLAGHAVVIGYWILQLFRDGLGFELDLLWLGSGPNKVYSDMAGWGHSLDAALLYDMYWLAVGGVLLAVARLFWVRGALSARSRLREARRRLSASALASIAAPGVLAAGLGGTLAVQTLVVGDYQTAVDLKRRQASVEKTHKAAWEGAPHPEVVAIETTVDLYGEEGRAEIEATMTLENRSGRSIERMLVRVPDEVVVRRSELSIPIEIEADEVHRLQIWTLTRPWAPGEQATLAFHHTYQQRGLRNDGFETQVVPNGTQLTDDSVFPSFGYERGWELSDPADRRKYDLPERQRMRDLDDPLAREYTYLTDDAQRIELTATVCTDAGQIPMAPGDLVDERTEGDRRCRTYQPDDPILYLFSFLSADWVRTTSEEGPVPVEVYADPAHPHNVARMIEAMNDSLRLFERDLGPFQHDVLRIVEFPRYAQFAQSQPAMIPFSESIGFIADVGDLDEDIDYVYYVTAHEVAHQWWAHQVCGGDGQGATVLTESLSQYYALKVMEAEYGSDQIDRFLTYEADRYFSGRANERDEELPLMRVENQQYIHYAKGGLVLWTLSQRIGPRRFDAALQQFLQRWRLVGPPYPTARDLVEHLESSFPEHIDAIGDGFRRIVRYDLRLTEASTRPVDAGFEVQLQLVADRIESDGAGRDTTDPLHDTLMVEAETEAGDTARAAVQLTGSGSYTAVFAELPAPPVAVRLDPLARFLEQDRDDNEATPTQ
ncbi:MAG: hypothetical protein KTR31_17770 [Myxococcales bacterium]|nr:hypothetical protein [Myxococcales bacterium]